MASSKPTTYGLFPSFVFVVLVPHVRS